MALLCSVESEPQAREVRTPDFDVVLASQTLCANIKPKFAPSKHQTLIRSCLNEFRRHWFSNCTLLCVLVLIYDCHYHDPRGHNNRTHCQLSTRQTHVILLLLPGNIMVSSTMSTCLLIHVYSAIERVNRQYIVCWCVIQMS